MKWVGWFLLVVLVLLSTAAWADEPHLRDNLVGTWMISFAAEFWGDTGWPGTDVTHRPWALGAIPGTVTFRPDGTGSWQIGSLHHKVLSDLYVEELHQFTDDRRENEGFLWSVDGVPEAGWLTIVTLSSTSYGASGASRSVAAGETFEVAVVVIESDTLVTTEIVQYDGVIPRGTREAISQVVFKRVETNTE